MTISKFRLRNVPGRDALASAYAFVLGWDFPGKQSAAPGDLGRETGTAVEEKPISVGNNMDTIKRTDSHGAS